MGGFDWGAVWYAVPYMLHGTLITLEISFCAMVLATIVGVVLGLISVSDMRLLTAVVRAYVYFVRGTPALVQIFLVYFALPRIGFELSSFWSGVVALAFNSAGFIAEIVRAGLQSIDTGQTEAALSIGMTGRQAILFILLPQSLRRITPPLTNEVITLIKSSSLLSVISDASLSRHLERPCASAGCHGITRRCAGVVSGTCTAASGIAHRARPVSFRVTRCRRVWHGRCFDDARPGASVAKESSRR